MKQARKIVLSIDWSDVIFCDYYILIKIGSNWTKKFPLAESRKSLNSIKNIYEFKNIPKLVIEKVLRIDNNIIKIQNIEVLYYCIEFFKFKNSFDKSSIKKTPPSISRFKKFTKCYYRKYISQIFTPKCFNYLCELALDKLPDEFTPQPYN